MLAFGVFLHHLIYKGLETIQHFPLSAYKSFSGYKGGHGVKLVIHLYLMKMEEYEPTRTA
jgi:hypothetical protein